MRRLLGLLLAFWAMGCTCWSEDVDVRQERWNSATAPLRDSSVLVQSFTCSRPGLYAIEVLPAFYDAAEQGRLFASVFRKGPEPTMIAELSVDVAGLKPNQPLAFTFAPQWDSAGHTYDLLLTASPDLSLGFWYCSDDVYGGGHLQLGPFSVDSGDLRLVTRCYYNPLSFSQAATVLVPQWLQLASPEQWAWLPMVVIMVLLLPGFLVMRLLWWPDWGDVVAGLGFCVALSLTCVPVALLWSSAIGLHWSQSGVALAGSAAGLCTVALISKSKRNVVSLHLQLRNPVATGTALLLLVGTLVLRFVQIRGLLLPAWVDSPQHVLVAQLVALNGGVPQSYEPLLPVSGFAYHFGFHATLVLFHWLGRLPLPQGMLVLGQILNVAAALSVYLLSARLARRRLAGIFALFMVGFVSFMPAYYLSWGRYTQLAGLVALPGAVVAAMEWLARPRRRAGLLALSALMCGGLFLVHARVTVFAACFVVAYLFVEVMRCYLGGHYRELGELLLRAVVLLFITLVVIAPWLAQVFQTTREALRASNSSLLGDASYNAFPLELLWVRHNREMLALAGMGVLLGVLRRRREVLWVVCWCALVGLVVNPGVLGLPATNLLNNATAVISLYLPLAVLVGGAGTALFDGVRGALARDRGRVAAFGRRCLAPAGVLALTVGVLYGFCSLSSVVNPTTVLVDKGDLAAMDWIAANTSEDATFLINAREWQLGVYAGTDAGYWIHCLTGRRILVPELPYVYGSRDVTSVVSEVGAAVSKAGQVTPTELWDVARRAGATHVYIGSRGGPLEPDMFGSAEQYDPVYSADGVWIFEVVWNTDATRHLPTEGDALLR